VFAQAADAPSVSGGLKHLSARAHELEKLFSAKKVAPTDANAPDEKTSGDDAKKGAAGMLIESGIINQRRAMNLDIMLKRFTAQPREITEAVRSLDVVEWRQENENGDDGGDGDDEDGGGGVLTVENLQALIDNDLKEEDELAPARGIELNETQECELQPAEALLYFAARVSRWSTRVAVARTLRTYQADADAVRVSVEKLVKACEQVMNSEGLRIVLATVLEVGNYLNQGTRRGNARGFKLDALLKLVDTRTQDKKSTVLHYVVDLVSSGVDQDGDENVTGQADGTQVKEKEKEDVVEKLRAELSDLAGASKVSKDEIGNDVSVLRKRVAVVGRELAEQAREDESGVVRSSEGYQRAVRVHASAEEVVRGLEEELLVVEERAAQLAKYLGENARKARTEDMFGTLVVFTAQLAKCRDENNAKASKTKPHKNPRSSS